MSVAPSSHFFQPTYHTSGFSDAESVLFCACLSQAAPQTLQQIRPACHGRATRACSTSTHPQNHPSRLARPSRQRRSAGADPGRRRVWRQSRWATSPPPPRPTEPGRRRVSTLPDGTRTERAWAALERARRSAGSLPDGRVRPCPTTRAQTRSSEPDSRRQPSRLARPGSPTSDRLFPTPSTPFLSTCLPRPRPPTSLPPSQSAPNDRPRTAASPTRQPDTT